MPLSMEVGVSPGEFVLDGDLAALPKRELELLSPQLWTAMYNCYRLEM